MNNESILKLRAGNTIYVVSMGCGMIHEIFVRRVTVWDGSPCVTGDYRVIFDEGKPFTGHKTQSNCNFLFFTDVGFASQNYRTTRSKNRAMKWAKLGYKCKPIHVVSPFDAQPDEFLYEILPENYEAMGSPHDLVGR